MRHSRTDTVHALVFGASLLALALTHGCEKSASTTTTQSAANEPVVIGVINPLTGPFAAYGEPVRDGILLRLQEINAAGGIKGRPLKLIMEDDAGDPKSAVNAFTKLATVDKVPAIIGPLSSGCSMATAPLADRYKVVQLSTLAGTIDLSHAGNYVFRIYPSSELGSRYIARTAVEQFQAKRLAIFYPNNPFGVASRKFVTEVVEKARVPIVAVETFNDGDRDFRAQLTRIAQAKPDVLLCSAYYEEGARILVQAKQLGLDVPVLGEDGWFGPIASIAGAALSNLYFANVAFGSEYKDKAQMQQFIRSFQLLYKHPPNTYAAAGAAAVSVLVSLLEQGGSRSTELPTLLYGLTVHTPIGTVSFDSNGDDIGLSYDLFQLSDTNEALRARRYALTTSQGAIP